ncbi:MAG: L,D-transpeptidase family protein [Planctomycetota bacterium]|nr:L,D-transpeptidase family protein [Planctomycetota bacterium]
MARHPLGSHGGQRSWIYIISALLVIVVVVALIYGLRPFSKNNKEEPGVAPPDINVPAANKTTAPKPKPVVESEPNLPTIVPGPIGEPNEKVAELLLESMASISTSPSRIIEARDSLNKAMGMPMSAEQRAFVREQLSELANKWLFSRTVFPNDTLCGSYTIKPGDQLQAIGEQFKVPYEILMAINSINRPEVLQAGGTIKVINGPFHARIYRSAFTMDLYLQNTFVRSFRVGLGKPGRETPTGLWVVKPGDKLPSPQWKDPDTGRIYKPEDPDYPLGSRWIGLEGIAGAAKGRTGFAIHGTKEPTQIGTAGSRGCIRLHNGDVILVYNLLMPVFSQVEVME